MRTKATLLLGAAAGYVLGTRAGRERYEQIRRTAGRAWRDPRVQEKVADAESAATETARTKGPELSAKVTETARSLADTARTKVSGLHSGGSSQSSGTSSTGTSSSGTSSSGSSPAGSSSAAASSGTSTGSGSFETATLPGARGPVESNGGSPT